MERLFKVKFKIALPIATCFLLVLSTAAVRAGDKVQLSGYWNYNAKQSDDAGRKVQEAQIDSVTGVHEAHGGGANPTAGTTDPGGGIGQVGGDYPNGGGMGGRGGMGGGMGGMGGMGGIGRGTRQGTRGPEVSGEQWDRLAANPKYLHIDQTPDQIAVTIDAEEAHTFYLDGKKHDDKDLDGRKISTKGQWDKDNFVAETKLNRSRRITETYRLSEDGKRLTVTTQFEDSSLNQPVTIRRVYDAGKAPAN